MQVRHRHTRSKPVSGVAHRGIFAGKHIQFGNTVSHSLRKHRRHWKPNIQIKSFYSEILSKWFQVKVTTRAMRCIDKAGGFDNYFINTKKKNLGEGLVLDIREEILACLEKRELEENRQMINEQLDNEQSSESESLNSDHVSDANDPKVAAARV